MTTQTIFIWFVQRLLSPKSGYHDWKWVLIVAVNNMFYINFRVRSILWYFWHDINDSPYQTDLLQLFFCKLCACTTCISVWWHQVCHICHGPLARYIKVRVAHAPGMPGTFSPAPWVSDPDMHQGTCVTHVPCCMPGSLTSGFLWIRWRWKRSWHSRRMCIPQFYVSGKRPMVTSWHGVLCRVWGDLLVDSPHKER